MHTFAVNLSIDSLEILQVHFFTCRMLIRCLKNGSTCLCPFRRLRASCLQNGISSQFHEPVSISTPFFITAAIQIRINYELETRAREYKTLQKELDLVHAELSAVRTLNSLLSDKIDCLMNEGISKSKLAPEVLTNENDGSVSNRGYKPQKCVSTSSASPADFSKENHALLSWISAKSQCLSQMTTSFCEGEMDRTRKLDQLVETIEKRTSDDLRSLAEASEVMKQLEAIRGDYDAGLIEDFHTLIDLALTADKLELELINERRSQKRSKARMPESVKTHTNVVYPIMDSTLRLQSEVKALAQVVHDREETYKAELDAVHHELSRLKSTKARTKSSFQQSLKSMFKDFEVLMERLDRCEATLEKLNVHYQVSEDEIMRIVSPILDTIDRARDQIQSLSAEAEAALYDDSS